MEQQTAAATDEQGIPDTWLGLDVGPKSREIFKKTVLDAKTILWNGYGPSPLTPTLIHHLMRFGGTDHQGYSNSPHLHMVPSPC